MTLDEIAALLPGILHDAGLRTLTIDYTSRQAILGLRIFTADPEAKTEAEREAYQSVTLTISGLLWCVIECPKNFEDAEGQELWIDAGSLDSLKERPKLPEVPERIFVWWIFVQQWNAFIYLAGAAASVRPRIEQPA